MNLNLNFSLSLLATVFPNEQQTLKRLTRGAFNVSIFFSPLPLIFRETETRTPNDLLLVRKEETLETTFSRNFSPRYYSAFYCTWHEHELTQIRRRCRYVNFPRAYHEARLTEPTEARISQSSILRCFQMVLFAARSRPTRRIEITSFLR